jgi:hypothetical protein
VYNGLEPHNHYEPQQDTHNPIPSVIHTGIHSFHVFSVPLHSERSCLTILLFTKDTTFSYYPIIINNGMNVHFKYFFLSSLLIHLFIKNWLLRVSNSGTWLCFYTYSKLINKCNVEHTTYVQMSFSLLILRKKYS